ncbi:MAG: hypothetical protein RLY31_1385 [Bacteroidota bacterium]
MVLVSIVFLLGILLSAWLHIRMRNKHRTGELIRIEAEYKRRQAELEREMLASQVENQHKQLTTEVIYRIQKNEMMREVVEKLVKWRRHEHREIRDTVNSVVRKLERSMEDEAWEDFEIRFQGIHDDFYKKLMQLHPGLSINERRLCAFLKLDLSTKEIAAITRQSPAALQVARFRLRQKLGLQDSGQDLSEYIASL